MYDETRKAPTTAVKFLYFLIQNINSFDKK